MFTLTFPGSFRRQLTLIVTASLLAVALATSLVTSAVIGERLQSWVRDYLLQLTDQFAANSLFAFLVEDTTLAQQALANLRAFPGVQYVAILKPDYAVRVSDGTAPAWALAHPPGAGQYRPALAAVEGERWHFAAPVRTRPLPTPDSDTAVQPQLLGYLHIVWDSRALAAIQAVILVINGGMAFAIAVPVILWLRRRIRRLTEPLTALTALMQQAQAGVGGVRATLAGPVETRKIGAVFNAMIDELERHQASLESQVEIRTGELRAARDAALTAVRHKSAFLAAITHEMRTPLHVIQAYSEYVLAELAFVEDQDSIADVVRSLRTVHGKAQELFQRINQILDLARLEARKLEVKIEPTELRELLQRLIETVRPLAARNRNRLESRVDGERFIEIDQDKLSQIVLNLLTNACKFTADGTIMLRAECTSTVLAIEVLDTGIGIPADQHALIFEPFRQVDMSVTRQYEGTGLGLAITKSFCELLGGRVTVASTVGEGSCFRVTIPLPVAARVSVESMLF
ncbi:MAG: HAMP domain-containing sensor histidine kinase [Gammaproteobacteria bacterium]